MQEDIHLKMPQKGSDKQAERGLEKLQGVCDRWAGPEGRVHPKQERLSRTRENPLDDSGKCECVQRQRGEAQWAPS